MSPAFDPQAAFQQLTQRLDTMQASQDQTQQILLQTVEIQTAMLDALRHVRSDVHELKNDVHELKNDVHELKNDVHELKNDVHELKNDVKQLRDSHLTLLKVQNNMLDFMKFTFDKQAQWNERQDQFNIIFLDELRDLKREVRQRNHEAKTEGDKMYQEIKDRLGRLEDFMNDQLRKAS